MNVRASLRPIDLAQAFHVSVQQVRNYEASGLIPAAKRSLSGHRRYTEQHRMALETARGLVDGFGWHRARAIMRAIHDGDLDVALAFVDARHAELTANRLKLDQTLAVFGTLTAQSSSPTAPHRAQRLRVGEAAAQVGVRVSALRFWEQERLLHPTRDAGNRYRIYDGQQLGRLRVVVLLREAGYGFDAIRTTLDELAAGEPAKTIAAVEKRRTEIARISWSCLGALAMLYTYIRTYWAEQYADMGQSMPLANR
jgi:DNA-binding transcriptional MerR regulator